MTDYWDNYRNRTRTYAVSSRLGDQAEIVVKPSDNSVITTDDFSVSIDLLTTFSGDRATLRRLADTIYAATDANEKVESQPEPTQPEEATVSE